MIGPAAPHYPPIISMISRYSELPRFFSKNSHSCEVSSSGERLHEGNTVSARWRHGRNNSRRKINIHRRSLLFLLWSCMFWTSLIQHTWLDNKLPKLIKGLINKMDWKASICWFLCNWGKGACSLKYNHIFSHVELIHNIFITFVPIKSQILCQPPAPLSFLRFCSAEILQNIALIFVGKLSWKRSFCSLNQEAAVTADSEHIIVHLHAYRRLYVLSNGSYSADG